MTLTPRRAAAFVVLAASGYGALSIATTLAARDGVGLSTLMAWRYTLAAPILVLIAGLGTIVRVPWRRALALLVLGGGGQSIVTFLSLSALEWMPAASLGFLFYTYPAWVAVFAAVAGIEPLTKVRIAALALALGGITMMVGAPWNLSLPLPGVIRALGSAVIYALYIPMLHRLRGPLSAAAASAFTIAGASVIFIVMSVRDGGPFANVTPFAIGLGALIAVWSTVVAFITFLRGVEALGAVRSAILSTSEPFFTAVYALLILSQPLTGTTLAGGALIIGAILLLERRTPPTPDAPSPA
jgi:drug/metabolite transporter (DMT)-like permease